MKTGIYLLLLACFWVVSTVSCGLFVQELPNGEAPNPTKHDHFVKIDGIHYHYIEYPAPGQDIFLLHGFASSTYTWEKIAPLLQSRGYHVWALDMKGFGWSDKPEGGDYGPRQLMTEVNAWMDKMGLNQVVFVGNSLGGAIAWNMALEHPEKVKKLVLIDSAGLMHQLPLAVRLSGLPGAATAARLVFGRWMIEDTLHQVYFNPALITEKQIDAYYDRMRTENAIDALTALAQSVTEITHERDAKRIQDISVDTLIIWGRDDAWIPLEDGFEFKKALPNATLEVIPFCGHVPQEEKPEETARIILEFLAKH